MYLNQKVNLFVEIINPEFYTILSRYLQNLICVDTVHLIKYQDSPYVKSSVFNLKLHQKIQIFEIDAKNQKSTFQYIQNNAKEEEINIYINNGVLFLSPKWDLMLCASIENEPICPMIVGTSRCTYLCQVMGILPSWLTQRYDLNYVDEFKVHDLPPKEYHEIHEKNIELIEAGMLGKYNMGRNYIFQEHEHKPLEVIAWKGAIPKTCEKASSWIHDTKMKMIGTVIATHWSGPADHEIVSKYAKITVKKNIDSALADDLDTILPVGLIFKNDTSKEFQPKIAISSFATNLYTSVPLLLQSIIHTNKIEPNRILVVVGNSEKEKVEIQNGVTYSHVTHNSFDHNALIDIVEKEWAGDQWFVLHDTCKMGPKLMEKVLKKGPTKTHISLLKEGWLNMGLFSSQYIRTLAPYILSLKNCNKMRAILSEKMYNRFDSEGFYDEIEGLKFLPATDIYGDGVERAVLHFTGIDLYKYQTYYHMSESTRKLVDEHLVKYPRSFL